MKTKFYAVLIILLILSISAVTPTNGQEAKRNVVITTSADAGTGSLRAALLDAQPGDHITFDPEFFSQDNPTSIFVESQLPPLDTGGVIIDGSGAGVIIDGSLLGKTMEPGFIDDISLITDTGENLITNGDFQEDLSHWLIWQQQDLDNFRWNGEVGAQSEGSIELTPNPHSGDIMLAYQTRDVEVNLHGIGNEPSGTSDHIPISGVKHLTLNFQYTQTQLSVNIEFMMNDGTGSSEQGSKGYDFTNSWSQGEFEIDVPLGAEEFILTFNIVPNYLPGLTIISDNNIVQGIQIINFPGDAIFLDGASRNQIGGRRQNMNAPCVFPCNLLSGNAQSGIFLQGGGHNTIQGNFTGTDISGVAAQPNGINGVRIFSSSNNVIGGQDGKGNLISANSMGIEINEGAFGNHIIGNFVGVDISGEKPLSNPHAGISLAFDAHDNVIENNVISSVQLDHQSYNNQILNNAIGTNISHTIAIGNGEGILISNGAYDNKIGPGNYIVSNHFAGILVSGSDTLGNRITQNVIYDNLAGGIIVSNSSDDWISPPTDITATSRKIYGYAQPGIELEIYTDESNQGRRYLGTAFTDENGYFSVVIPAGEVLDEYITVLAFDKDGTTSQFSPGTAPEKLIFQTLPGFIGPEQVSKDPKVIRTNILLAVVSIIFLGAGTTYFNETLEVYSSEINAMYIAPIRKRIGRISPSKKKKSLPRKYDLKRVMISWLLILLIVSVIQSLLDTDVFFTKEQLFVIATLFLGGFVISGLQSFSEWLMRKLDKRVTQVEQAEVGWAGVILAAISTIASLILRLRPGIVLGAVDTFFLKPDWEDDNKAGYSVFIIKFAILSITFLGWIISSSAAKLSPSLGELLITLFLVGLQYAFFELLPLDVLDGLTLYKHNRFIWLLLFGITTFGMFHLVFNPNSSDVQDILQNDIFTLFSGMALLGTLAILLRWRISIYKEEPFKMTKKAWVTVLFIVGFLLAGVLTQFGIFDKPETASTNQQQLAEITLISLPGETSSKLEDFVLLLKLPSA